MFKQMRGYYADIGVSILELNLS